MSTLIPPDLTATLAFVRHGETTWIAQDRFQGQANPWLTDLGRAQAEAVARRLADPQAPPPLPVPPGPPLGIWISPLKRARDSAAAIAKAVGVPASADPRLAELSQGDWQGLRREQVIGLGGGFAAWLADPVRNAAPGGETVRAAAPRVRNALAAILSALQAHAAAGVDANPWGIVVSHGGTMKVALLLLLDLPLAHFWDFPFDPGGISIVEMANGRAMLRAHNLTAHLASVSTGGMDREGAL